jgi:hypothetical protein
MQTILNQIIVGIVGTNSNLKIFKQKRSSAAYSAAEL